LNLDTKSIIQSREIIWLNEVYQDWIERKVSRKKEIDDDGDDNDNDDYDYYNIENSKIQEVDNGQDRLRNSQD
jgi:hypothetical protein